MNWPEAVNLAAPIAATIIGMLLTALCVVLWWLLVRLVDRVTKLGDSVTSSAQEQSERFAAIAKEQAERFATVDNFIRTELRTMDVRLSVVETMLSIRKT